MNATEDKKNIDLTNGRVVSGAICAGFVPPAIFILLAIFGSNSEGSIFLIFFAFYSMVPGFLSIFVPCFALLWLGKTKPGWFAAVPAIVIVPQLLIYNPSQGFIRIGPTNAMIAVVIAAFAGLLCWFISVRLDPQFRNKSLEKS